MAKQRRYIREWGGGVEGPLAARVAMEYPELFPPPFWAAHP